MRRQEAQEHRTRHGAAGGGRQRRGRPGVDRRLRPGGSGEPAVGCNDRVQLLRSGAEREELGTSLNQVDRGGGQFATGGGQRPAPPTSRAGREHRHDQAGQHQPRGERQARSRQQHPREGHGAEHDDERHHRWRQSAKVDLLHLPDIVDDPGEQLAARAATERFRGDPGERAVDVDPQVTGDAERGIVGAETLRIAAGGAADPEGPDADDGDRQLGELRVL